MCDELLGPDEETPSGRVTAGRRRPPRSRADASRIRALEEELTRTRALVHEADHRAKNTLQVVTSLVLLQARRAADAPTLYAIAERINALSLVHRLLAEEEDGRFPLGRFLHELADEVRGTSGRIAIALDVPAIDVPAAKAPSLGLLLHEVLANAQRHAFPDDAGGHVSIRLAREADRVVVTVADDGVGTPDEPPEGFGLLLVDLLGRQLGAEIVREPARPGTRITVALPVEA